MPFYTQQNFESNVTFCRCIQNSCLETNRLKFAQTVLDGDLHTKSGVGVHIRQAQQVRTPYEEISVESMYGQTSAIRFLSVSLRKLLLFYLIFTKTIH